MRRQWEQLCNHAKDQSSSLSSDVDHWNEYQHRLSVLSPWLERAEQLVVGPVGQTSTLDEANMQYEQHQVGEIFSRI